MKVSVQKWLFAAAAVGLLAGCVPQKPSEARLVGKVEADQAPEAKRDLEKEPVVVVGGEAVTLAEFDRRVRQLPEFAQMRYSSIEKRQAYLKDVAQFEVMADRAEETGLGERPEVLWALKDALASQLVEDVVRERLSEETIDQAAIEAYYQVNQADFQEPRKRRVALIEVASREDAQRLRARVLAELDAAQDRVKAFRKAASIYSSDRASAAKGGDVGFVEAPQAHGERAALAEAVFALDEAGQVTEPVALDDGWALASFFEERAAHTRSLDAVATEIRTELTEKRRERLRAELLDELRAEMGAERDQALAEKARAPSPDGAYTLDEVPLVPFDPFEDDDIRSQSDPPN